MITNRLLFLFSLFFMMQTIAYSQQEPHHTQFMYNKLGINPAYAGSKNSTNFTGLYRSQWIGLEGAPNSQLLSFDTPLSKNKVGIGINLERSTIGISERWTFDGIYAYRIKIREGNLAFGIQASARYLSTNYLDERLIATQQVEIDNSIPSEIQNKYLLNFGAGIYYNTEKFYIGLSSPRLLKNSDFFSENNQITFKEIQHYYLMTGFIVDLNESLKLRPQLLLKYVDKTPFDFEVNISAIFIEKYTIGLSYRAGGSKSIGIGESIDFILAAEIADRILFGFSYDLSLSELKNHNTGSIEALIKYQIKKPEFDARRVINPRFF